jgi:hypothetical protein
MPGPLAGNVIWIVAEPSVHPFAADAVAVGATGAGFNALIVLLIGAEVQPNNVAVILYAPGDNPAKTPVVLDMGATMGLVPVAVYDIPAPIGVLTVIVPVDVVHNASVTVAVGTAGAPGTGSTIKLNAGDVHPTPLVVVTLYVPGNKPINTPELFVTADTTGLVPVTV